MDLNTERKEIDEIDDELLRLFIRRMEVAGKIAEIKNLQGLPVYRPEREKEIEKRMTSMAPEQLRGFVGDFFKMLMELSRDCQKNLIDPGSQTELSLLNRLSNPAEELEHPRVKAQGVQGSFAGAAAKILYPCSEITFEETWEDIFQAVESGVCDYGVLPVENSSAGSVGEVYDLLIKYKSYVVKALSLPVDQCLLGIPGAAVSEIRKVYSHPHALSQCRDFLKKHPDMEPVRFLNTAAAAEYVSRQGNPSYAAVSSRECASIYGLSVLADSIQQTRTNQTRFVSVSRRLEIPEEANKISLIFTLPHVTGSLYRTLSRFAHNGLNLTKIESRPDPQKNFEYQFFLDFTGNIRSGETLHLLGALSEELPSFYFLGNYQET